MFKLTVIAIATTHTNALRITGGSTNTNSMTESDAGTVLKNFGIGSEDGESYKTENKGDTCKIRAKAQKYLGDCDEGWIDTGVACLGPEPNGYTCVGNVCT